MNYIKRGISTHIEALLDNFPAVYINGPRQAGKTTLVKQMLHKGQFLTFDDAIERSLALRNPQMYLRDAGFPLIIDEVQLVPDIFRPLKMLIDEQRYEALKKSKQDVNGHYLLTGSANLAIIPALADAMVGRMATVSLLPLSAQECLSTTSNFILRCFSQDFSGIKTSTTPLPEIIQQATYPEISNQSVAFARDWMKNYINKITLDDPQQLYNLEKTEFMPLLLQALAVRAGNLINDADLSRDIGLAAPTARTYRNLLAGTFIVNFIQPWYHNIGKRLIKSPKVYFYDTMLLCHLLGSSPAELAKKQPHRFGHVLENFVHTELTKQNIINNVDSTLSFYRTRDGKEVDFILEKNSKIVALEVKNSEKITNQHISGIKELQSAAGKNFVCGIVLCNTPRVMRIEENIYLVPFSALWQ